MSVSSPADVVPERLVDPVGRRVGRPSGVSRAPTDYAVLLRSVQSAGLHHRRYGYYGVKVGLTFAALAGVWVVFGFLRDSWAQIGVAAVLAVVLTQIVFLSHDAAHRQIFRSNAANEYTALIMGTLVSGVSLAWWHNKHNRHHATPNQIGKDPDISPSIVHFYPVREQFRSAAARFLHQRQGWWFFPLLVVEMLNLHVQSVQALLTRPGLRRRGVEIVMMTVRLVGYPLVLFSVLPPLKAAVFLGVQLAVTGLYLGSAFAASHVGMPVLDSDSRVDFLRRQILTSRNVKGGRFASWAMGGLNLQIEHHLFPNVAEDNLRRVRPLVRQFCANHSVDYHEVTIFGAWALVVRHLNSVGLRAGAPLCPVVAALRPA